MHKVSRSASSFRYLFLMVILFLILPIKGFSKGEDEGVKVFRQVAEVLGQIKQVSYRYSCAFSYPAESYEYKSGGDMYIDFNKEHDLVGFRYQYKHAGGFSIFNNAELFDGLNKTMTIRYKSKLSSSSFEGQSALYGSLVTLRNLLPMVIEDDNIKKTVKDSIIDGQRAYVLCFDTHNSIPDYLGKGYSKSTKALTLHHRLLVNRKTLLPFTFLQSKYGSEDLNRTDFKQINLHPKAPEALSWYYSSYLDTYKNEVIKVITPIKKGAVAPDWMLNNLKGGQREALSNYKGKVLLMEFWIKNCGYCISAVEKLNALHKKYKSEKFNILAINTDDSETMANTFIKAHKTTYDVFWGNDASINNAYGVSSFPMVVLVDQAGTVVYSGDLDEEKISALIEKLM